MIKDPAFLFYSQDFLVGTLTMPFEDKGKYITILCYMHQNGPISDETIRLLVGNVSVSLMSKFSQCDDGLWYNKRLDIEVKKRTKFTESRKNNGAKGGRPPKNQSINGTYTSIDEKTDRLLIGKPKNNLSENEIDDVNDIKVDSKTDYEISREKKFCDDTLSFFGYNEINHFRNFATFRQAYRLFDLKDQLDYFIDQCENYLKYIDIIGKKYLKSFEKFIGSPEDDFTNGAWNSENWAQKVAEQQVQSQLPVTSFPSQWNQKLYLGLPDDESRRNYVSHLKQVIGGGIYFSPVGNMPHWKYPEKPKAIPGAIMQGLSNIGKEKKAS
jgi:hypothetical protein